MITPPKVLLFDIGGVCVTSPMQAIADYESTHCIPPGWINHSISSSGPQGSWSRLERGELPLDNHFFTSFHADLTNEHLWRTFCIRHFQNTQPAIQEAVTQVPAPPDIDAEMLFWEMMTVARTPDPYMWLALQRLRILAPTHGFILAALSNTCIFPPSHPFNDVNTTEGKFQTKLRGMFDIFISSAHVGMRKPEKRIYEYALGELGKVAGAKGWGGVEAKEVLFLDDIGGNLRGARELGMRTFKVELGRGHLAVAELERVMGLELTAGVAKL